MAEWKSIGVIWKKDVRRFIGWPKESQWKALLKRAGLEVLPKEPNRNGSWLIPRQKLTLDECRSLLRLRYAELGERLIRRRKPGLHVGPHGGRDGE